MKADRFKINDQDVELPVSEQPAPAPEQPAPAQPKAIPADAVPLADGQLDPVAEAILDEIPDRPKTAAPAPEQSAPERQDVERQDEPARLPRAALLGGAVVAVLGAVLLTTRAARPAAPAAAAPVAPAAPAAPAARPSGLVVK